MNYIYWQHGSWTYLIVTPGAPLKLIALSPAYFLDVVCDKRISSRGHIFTTVRHYSFVPIKYY